MKVSTKLNIGLAVTTFFALITNALLAQTPTIQDCFGAIPVCKNVYSEEKAPEGNGNFTEVEEYDGCVPIEESSIWYTFTVNRSGDFGFLITSNNINDDYDWALFDITNITCDDIINNSNHVVSCNNAGDNLDFMPRRCNGFTGATGATNLTSVGSGCEPGNSPFNDLVPVIEGNIYALLIVNWTGSQFGYEIDFSLGSAGIFDEKPPEASNNSNSYICTQSDDGFSSIPIQFNENIKCNTIDESNFSIVGPGGPYNFTLVSDECGLGAEYSKNFDLFVSPVLTNGEFVFEMNPINSFEILDVCDNASLPYTKTFSYDACAFGNVTERACDDGDPETIFDKEIVLNCDNEVICEPCKGVCGAFYDETIKLCENDTVLLQVGDLVSQAGFYQEILKAVNGCDSVLRSFVEENPKIGLQLAEQYFGFIDETNILETSVNIANPLYSWEPADILSCADCASPIVLATTYLEQIFTLTVTDEDTGCQATDLVDVLITDYNALYMPNAFSPNSDGINDFLNLNYTGGLQTVRWMLYNRYGQKLFETSVISDYWDGTYKGEKQPLGVYVYYAEATFPNNIVIKSKGNITLVR